MRLFIIASTIIHLSIANAATIGRCCNNGEILALNSNDLKCVHSTDQQLQQLFSATRKAQPYGLPYCGKLSHLVQILAEDVVEVPVEACLELFHDDESSLNFPVFVHCSPVVRTTTTTTRATIGAIARRIQHFRYLSKATFKPVPRFVHLRKCCPGNTAYDLERKFCVEVTNDDSTTDFRMLFDRLPSLDFINVYEHGAPSCYDAVLVNFKIEQVYHSAVAGVGEISMSVQGNGGSLKNLTINADTSCLDSYNNVLVARVCQELDYCEDNVCVRKCCNETAVDAKCAAAASTFANFSNALGNIKNYGLLMGVPCRDVFGPDDEYETWTLDNDTGNIIVQPNVPSYTEIYNYANSCLEFMTDVRGFSPMLCFPDTTDTPAEKWEVAGGLQLISCFFLALTFTVYCCLPSLQNLHGKTLMCHVASLFIAYGTLASSEFATKSLDFYDETVADKLCKVMSYILLLSFHSAFFWLNVMCFDIWWTFRGIRQAKHHRQTSRFLAYCTYAWGLALFFVVLLLSLEFAGVLENVIGRERCWFEYRSIVQVVFFLLPVNLTLVVNLTFFFVTARRCSKVKSEINRAMANDKCAKNFRSDRSRLIMNVKLFIVMGIPWIFENLTAFLEHYQTQPLWVQEIFYSVDIVNSLQGLWIFILFVLKSKVYEALRKRVRPNLAVQKNSSSKTNNVLSANKLKPRMRKSASSSTVTSCFLSSS